MKTYHIIYKANVFFSEPIRAKDIREAQKIAKELAHDLSGDNTIIHDIQDGYNWKVANIKEVK